MRYHIHKLRITAFIAVVRSIILVLLSVVDAIDKHGRNILRRLELVRLRGMLALAELEYDHACDLRDKHMYYPTIGECEALRANERLARTDVVMYERVLKGVTDVSS